MYGAIGQRIQQNAQNFGDMVIHVGLDPDALPEAGPAFERAIRRCLWCSHSRACREWLDAREKGDRVAPRFCPNAMFFARNVAAADPAATVTVRADRRADEPDDALLAIGREWRSAAAEYDASTLALDIAEERLEEIDPAPPEALYEQEGDRDFGLPAARLHHGGRSWYAPVIALVRARSSAATIPEARARLLEIVAAYDAWYAARMTAEEASGVWLAAARDKAACERVNALQARFISTPARTVEGLRQKAVAAVWSAGGVAHLEVDLRQSGQIDAALAMSIIRDLLAADTEH